VVFVVDTECQEDVRQAAGPGLSRDPGGGSTEASALARKAYGNLSGGGFGTGVSDFLHLRVGIPDVVTRPLGVTFADCLGEPRNQSGIGFGDGSTALALAVATLFLIIARADNQRTTVGAQ
jgi:hypothetical protein